MTHCRRKLHPADLRDAEVIANAVRFDLALFLGSGQYARASVTTLDEAAQASARLTLEHRNGRTPMIYAIDAAGRAALVTQQRRSEEMMLKTYAKKFNAQRAAKAAGHDADEVDVIKTKNGYTWRAKRQGKSAADPRDAKLAADPSREPPADGMKQSAAPRPPAGKRAAIEAAARKGKLPEPPDFSAPTHTRFRNKLASVVELAKAGDLKGLQAFQINPVSSSPKAIARYRDLCIVALEARQQAA